MNRAEQTRQRLQEAALRLFQERGFDQVTVEQIARAAGVSHMTFFRNFPTKEAVVVDDPYDPVIGEAIARQDPRLPVLQRVVAGMLEAWATTDVPGDDAMRTRLRLAAGHPALRARVWESNRRTEDVIVDALVNTGATPLDARVAAGAVLGALTAALLDWALDESGHGLGDRIMHALHVLGDLTGTTRP